MSIEVACIVIMTAELAMLKLDPPALTITKMNENQTANHHF